MPRSWKTTTMATLLFPSPCDSIIIQSQIILLQFTVEPGSERKRYWREILVENMAFSNPPIFQGKTSTLIYLWKKCLQKPQKGGKNWQRIPKPIRKELRRKKMASPLESLSPGLTVLFYQIKSVIIRSIIIINVCIILSVNGININNILWHFGAGLKEKNCVT